MTVFRLMEPQLRKWWPLAVLQVVCLVATAGVTVAVARVIQGITDAVVTARWETVVAQVGLALPLVALGALFSLGATTSSGVLASWVSGELRSQTLRRMVGFSLSYYESHHSADLVSRLTNDIGRVQGFFEHTLGSLLKEPLIFLVVALWLWIIDPWLVIPTLVLTLVLVVFILRRGPQVVRLYRGQQEGLSDLTKGVQDAVHGVAVVKAYGLQGPMMDRIRSANQTVADHVLGGIDISTQRSFVSAFCRYVPFLTTLVWGTWRTLQGELTPGVLFAYLYLFRSLNGALGNLADVLTEAQGIQAVIDRIAALHQQPLERVDGDPSIPQGRPLLEAHGLSFGYAEGQDVLQDLSFVVDEGQTVALVGTSGCGKSTLLKLLCGLEEPQAGEVRLWGRAHREWNLESLRRHFSLVGQESALFPGSVAENIGYGAPDADQGRIEAMAALAGAAGFIEALPQGYQTLVGERGVRLSGGQRQRIAIARALIKDAPILLLDEPTSSLDAESEARVQEAIETLMTGRTVVVAAHRLSTVRSAHQILVIEEGRIVERGTHEALMAAQGPYQRLYSRQLGANP